MDIEKLIERLSKYSEPVIAYKLDADFAASITDAISELRCKCDGCSVPATTAEMIRDLNDAPKLRAENEKLRAALEAARAALAELTGLADGSVQTLFGAPLDRMRELAQAELAGRIVLLSAGAGKKCGSCGHWHRIHDTRRGTCDVRRWLRDRYGASEPGTAFIPTQSYGACRDYIPREDDNHG